MINNKILYGGDYNPEQWLDYPEILEEDIIGMKKAHINVATINVFGWSNIEPEEGVYNFKDLDATIARLWEAGISIVLATPSGAIPRWMSNKYPEVLLTQTERQRVLPSNRHNFCYTSPVFKEKVKVINNKLAKRYAKHPAIVAWHLSNEYANNNSDGACHCSLCQSAFREWLKSKYKTLDNLNHAWWAHFWSHTYTTWEQIESPAPYGERLTHGLTLDWKRFSSEQMLDFCKMERKSVEEENPCLPVTTNLMATFRPLNYASFAPHLDIISYDSYPSWHMHETEIIPATNAAFHYDLMRSLKQKNFLLMESTPSTLNWKPRNIAKRPGMNMLSSLQAIAHGSDSVMYFQLRAGRGSSEKFHGAVIGHDGIDNRVFEEVTMLGERLERLSPMLKNTTVKSQVAIVFDWEVWWAHDDAQGLDKRKNYFEKIYSYYAPLREFGIHTDVISSESDLSKYSIVIAPFQYLYSLDYAKKVKDYVSNGGVYVSTCWSGIVDENDLCYMGHTPAGLNDVLGIVRIQTDSVNETLNIKVEYNGIEYPCVNTVEYVKICGAQILGCYKDKFYQNMAAITKNDFNKGKAYYIGAELTSIGISNILKDILEGVSIENALEIKLPKGVLVTSRVNESDNSAEFIFVQNYNDETMSFNLNKLYTCVETGEEIQFLNLKRYECRIIKKCVD